MPPKIRKKAETGGLNQPDQVMTSLQTTYGYIDKFKYHIVIGFVAIILVLLGISGFVSYRASNQSEVSHEFFEAFKLADAPSGEGAEKVKGLPVFEDDSAKFTALSEKLDQFLAANGSSDVATVARASKASALIKLGKFGEAYDLLKEVSESEVSAVLAPAIQETLGYLAVKLGNPEEAQGHFQAMRDASRSAYLKARALMHLGDMSHPMTTVEGMTADKEKARGYYDQALELLPKKDDPEADRLLKGAVEEIEGRIALLSL